MNADSFFYFYNNSNSMKKLIISNFIFLVILNAFVIAKEFLLSFYSGSGFEDFSYTKVETEGSFDFGLFRISIWWLVYFLVLSVISAYIFKYLQARLKKIWLVSVLVLFQIILCYWINRLMLTNIFGIFQIEKILISIFSMFIFWYIIVYKNLIKTV